MFAAGTLIISTNLMVMHSLATCKAILFAVLAEVAIPHLGLNRKMSEPGSQAEICLSIFQVPLQRIFATAMKSINSNP